LPIRLTISCKSNGLSFAAQPADLENLRKPAGFLLKPNIVLLFPPRWHATLAPTERQRNSSGPLGQSTHAEKAEDMSPLPKLIASVMGEGPRQAGESIARAAGAGADAVEIRLDAPGLSGVDGLPPLLAEAASHRMATVATCRRTVEGGGYSGDEAARMERLRAAAEAGADYIDLECEEAVLRRLGTLPSGCRLILSHHDLSGTMAGLDSLAGRMAGTARTAGVHPAFFKIATTAARLEDNLPLRTLLRGRASGDPPLAAFAMGVKGIPSRLLALSWGSAAVYFAADAGRPAAPGQIAMEEATRLYDVAGIEEGTRLFGIVGCPVSHSLSPRIHNAALAACRIDARYLPFETERFQDFLAVAGGLDMGGFATRTSWIRLPARSVPSTLFSAGTAVATASTRTRTGASLHCGAA
jgi:3-dehydroquinate dehydratase/shikimate dehydrogenase